MQGIWPDKGVKSGTMKIQYGHPTTRRGKKVVHCYLRDGITRAVGLGWLGVAQNWKRWRGVAETNAQKWAS